MLLPGDCLLYSGKSLFSLLIKIKTWSRISHVEVFLGNNRTFTAREGHGVGFYDYDPTNLAYILRPKFDFDFEDALVFARMVDGQKYDYLGLLRFFTLGKQSYDKQFCSEACTRFYRAGGGRPFADYYDADLVSPGMFLSSPQFEIVAKRI